MKWSILATVLILLAGSLFSWQQQREVRCLEEVVHVLSLEAEALGITSEDLLISNRVSRQRENRSERVGLFLEKLIEFTKKQEEWEDESSEDMQEEMMFLEELVKLSAMDLKELLLQMLNRNDLKDEGYFNWMIYVFSKMLVDDSPRSVLELFSQTGDARLTNDGIYRDLLPQALGKLAAEDPQAAFAWMKENEERFPEMSENEQKISLLETVAREDMTLALSLLDEIKVEEGLHEDFLGQLASSAGDVAAADAILTKMRGLGEGEEIDRLGSLADSPFFRDFAQATTWLEKVQPTEEEAAQIVSNMKFYQTEGDIVKWLDWIGEKMPEKAQQVAAQRYIGQWAQQDHRAVGAWLNEQKSGAMKSAAVASFAKTLAPHEPASAAEWAETLPEGKMRESALKDVYRSWSRIDEAAAGEFAEKHHLKR